ncbi:MAG: hypothetical protein ABI687_05175 [Flavitalea sp.]
MNHPIDPKDKTKNGKDHSTATNPSSTGTVKQKQSDPQLTELDGLKKGGVDPVVNPEDKEIDKHKAED